MKARPLPILALLSVAAMLAAAAAGAAHGNAESKAAEEFQSPRNMGVLCMWALVSAAAEVGRRCRAGWDPAFQSELDRSVSRFDEFVRQNSAMTAEQVAEFKREQGLVGAPEAELCTPEIVPFFDHMAAAGREELRSSVDRMLAQPRAPTWGDCL